MICLVFTLDLTDASIFLRSLAIYGKIERIIHVAPLLDKTILFRSLHLTSLPKRNAAITAREILGLRLTRIDNVG
jgi:hypothetical protein